MATPTLVWLEAKLDPMAAQLMTISNSLDNMGLQYGLTQVEINQWHNGAATNNYLQTQLIPAVRDYSGGLTDLRGELHFDKTINDFAIPPFVPPPPPVLRDAPALKTDFCDWCDTLYKRMKLTGGLTDAVAKTMGFLVPAPDASEPNPATLQSRIVSILTEAGGRVTVTAERQHQPQIHFRITLDTGEVLNKTLPNSQATFTLPTDRVHHFEATAIYADRNADDYGQWSDPKGDTSEL